MDGNKGSGKERSVSPTYSYTPSSSASSEDNSSSDDSKDMNETVIFKGDDQKDDSDSSSPSFPKSDETWSLHESLKTILNETDGTLKNHSKDLNKNQTTLEGNGQKTEVSNRSDPSSSFSICDEAEPPKDRQDVSGSDSVHKILKDGTKSHVKMDSKSANQTKTNMNVYKISPITFTNSDDEEKTSRSPLSDNNSPKYPSGVTNKTNKDHDSKEEAQVKEDMKLKSLETTNMKGIRSTDVRTSSEDLATENNGRYTSRSLYEQKSQMHFDFSRDLFHDTIKDAQTRLKSVLHKLDHTSKPGRLSPELDFQSKPASVRMLNPLQKSKDFRNPNVVQKQFKLHCAACDDDFLFGQICEDCRVLSCTSCFGRIHPWPLEGKFQNHVVSNVTRYDVMPEMCLIHNLLFSYYCTTCKKKKCSDCCALSRDCTHNTIIKIEEYFKKKREDLVKQQKETSSKCVQKTDMMLSLLDDKAEEIQDRWMFHKEMLHLEFISLHDVITQCESTLMNQFEQEVEASLNKVMDLKHQYGDTLEKEAMLTSTTLDLLEDKSNMRFNKRKTIIEKRWKSLQKQTDKLQTVGDDLNPPFFEQKISLYEEKHHLQECLKKENFSSMRVQPFSSCIYLPEEVMDSPIFASELWKPPATLLPSTHIGYDVQIKLHTKTILWKTNCPMDINEVVFNEFGKVFLRPGQKYLVKVTPVYVTTINGVINTLNTGKPRFIFLVTGSEVLKRSFEPSFEENRYYFLVKEEKRKERSIKQAKITAIRKIRR